MYANDAGNRLTGIIHCCYRHIKHNIATADIFLLFGWLYNTRSAIRVVI